MFLRITHRVLSLSLATVMALGMLGGLGGLSQSATATATANASTLWAAQNSSVRA